MAQVELKPALTACHGRMDGLVFVNRLGKQHVRMYTKPSNPNTPAQRERRGTFRDAVHAWQALPDTEKERWKAKAASRKRTGYNLFVSRFLRGGADISGQSGVEESGRGYSSSADGIRQVCRDRSTPLSPHSNSVIPPLPVRDIRMIAGYTPEIQKE